MASFKSEIFERNSPGKVGVRKVTIPLFIFDKKYAQDGVQIFREFLKICVVCILFMRA